MKSFRCFLFGHADRLHERDQKGRLVLRCSACGHDYLVLPKQKFRARKVKKPARVLRVAERKQA